MIHSRCACFLVAALCVAATGALRAYEPGRSHVEAKLGATTLEVTVAFALGDVQSLLPAEVVLGSDSSRPTIAAARGPLEELHARVLEVRADGARLDVAKPAVEFTPSDHLGFRYVFPKPPGATFEFTLPQLAKLPRGHVANFVFLDEDGFTRAERTLTADNAAIRVVLPEATGAGAVAPATSTGKFPASNTTFAAQATAPSGGEASWRDGFRRGARAWETILFAVIASLAAASWRARLTGFAQFAAAALLAAAGISAAGLAPWTPTTTGVLAVASVGVVGLLNLWGDELGRGVRVGVTVFAGVVQGVALACSVTGVTSLGFAFGATVVAMTLGFAGVLVVAGLRARPAFVPRGVALCSGAATAGALVGVVQRAFFP